MEADLGMIQTPDAQSDIELMREVAGGEEEALQLLYGRYAKLIFHMALQSLDSQAAEEIVQEVFLTVWRKAATFDPERGSFRGWIMRITHLRIINELRRRSRRPQQALDPDGEQLAQLPDTAEDPVEATWRAYCRTVVRSAMETLPQTQRQALGLAFFEDLTHEQVAAVLHLPLGTVKTRIRSGMQKLRVQLMTLMVVLLVAGLGAIAVRYQAARAILQRDDRALGMLTASDVVSFHLSPLAGLPADAHGNYRTRPGATLAVITLFHMPATPQGQVYQVWIRHDGGWVSLGSGQTDATGGMRVIAEGTAVTQQPMALEVTLEPRGGSQAPSGRVMLAWPAR